ncbi:MAG: hypothetical protein V9E93_16610 [Steroidobacteraceae bacterium]
MLILVWPYPLFTGAVIPDERPLAALGPRRGSRRSGARRPPAIDADARPGKVLVLPLDDYYQMPTTWGFSGVDSIVGPARAPPRAAAPPRRLLRRHARLRPRRSMPSSRRCSRATSTSVPSLLASLGVSAR